MQGPELPFTAPLYFTVMHIAENILMYFHLFLFLSFSVPVYTKYIKIVNCAVAIYEPPISSKTCCFLSLTRNVGNKQEDCSLCIAMLGLSLVNKSPIQPFLLFPSPDQGNNGQIKTSFFVLFFFDSSPLCGLKFLSCVFQEHRRQKGKCWRFNQSSCVKDGSHISPIPMTIAALTPRAKIII